MLIINSLMITLMHTVIKGRATVKCKPTKLRVIDNMSKQGEEQKWTKRGIYFGYSSKKDARQRGICFILAYSFTKGTEAAAKTSLWEE